MSRAVALYVDPRGPYPALLGVDSCWDQRRDARSYGGPNPIIAHPPCGPWGRLKHLYQGDEHDCAPRALEQVRAFGGVLEHPAGSQLWQQDAALKLHLGRFGAWCDQHGGFCMVVDQVEWGHVARKRTWLYIVAPDHDTIRDALAVAGPPPFPGREPTHWVSGFKSKSRCATAQGSPVPPGIKICSAQQRRRTPPLFAAWLAALAWEVRLGS